MFAKGSGAIILLPLCLAALIVILQGVVLPTNVVPVSGLLLVIFLFLLVFFRDPEREIAGGVASPADGVVREVSERDGRTKISIFMNVHNVHVNRSPLDGRVMGVEHVRGSHIPAFRKESERNERNVIELSTTLGDVTMVQIAGTVARRIVSYVEAGMDVQRGQRVGMIRLGSRVDLYMPTEKVKVTVNIGDRVQAGSSKLAEVIR